MGTAFKRLGAYFLDLIIIYMVASLISSVVLVTANQDQAFLNKFNEYNTFDLESANFKTLYKDAFSDNKLTIAEYDELIESYDKLTKNYEVKDIELEEAYKDNKLTKKEYNHTLDIINENYDNISPKLYYEISKLNVFNAICSVIITLLYFVFVPYFMNGQTFGKKILRFRVLSNNSNKATINQLLLRSLVITDVIWGIIRIYCLYNMDAYGYYNAVFVLNSMIYYVLFISLLCMMYRQDKRALQDLFANTKVIEEKK